MHYYIALAIILLAYMTCWFGISLIKRRNDVADIAWGLGFVLMAWTAFFVTAGPGYRGLVLAVLVSIWGIRLAWHIFLRNRGKPEDYRYATWRRSWGKWFGIRSYLQVYLLQGIFLFLIVLPVLVANRTDVLLGWVDMIGVAVWAVGFLFESIGDAQLASFKRDPASKGKLMTTGLWRYTRHPNYFGEVLQWWAIWIVALSVPGGAYAVVGPLTITVLILFVSGVPLLENKYAGRKDWEAYKKQTSMFVPLPPRKG